MSVFSFTTNLGRGLLLAGLLSFGSLGAAWAQGPGNTGPMPPGAATAVPLDGGASLLLAAGLGLKKLRQYRTRLPDQR